jgi:hypothetical protein
MNFLSEIVVVVVVVVDTNFKPHDDGLQTTWWIVASQRDKLLLLSVVPLNSGRYNCGIEYLQRIVPGKRLEKRFEENGSSQEDEEICSC